MPKDGATLLSDLTTDALIVRCDVCRRLGRYSVGRLLARRGDMRLTDFQTTFSNENSRASVHFRANADISVAGVRIVLQRRFEKGSGLAIELPGDGVREPTVVFVKVMHVRSQPNATHPHEPRSGRNVHRLVTPRPLGLVHSESLLQSSSPLWQA